MADRPRLDPSVLSALADDLGGEETVREVVRLFLTDLGDRRGAVVDAHRAGDGATVRAQAHAVTSAAAMLGARELAERSRELELAAPGAPVDGASVTRWSTACEHATSDLRAWVG